MHVIKSIEYIAQNTSQIRITFNILSFRKKKKRRRKSLLPIFSSFLQTVSSFVPTFLVLYQPFFFMGPCFCTGVYTVPIYIVPGDQNNNYPSKDDLRKLRKYNQVFSSDNVQNGHISTFLPLYIDEMFMCNPQEPFKFKIRNLMIK